MENNKIHIKPKSQQRPNQYNKPYQPKRNFAQEIDELKKMVKNAKQQVRQLDEQEKNVEEMIDKEITLELINGSERKGVLKYYGKYNIEIKVDDTIITYMKHAILGYRLD